MDAILDSALDDFEEDEMAFGSTGEENANLMQLAAQAAESAEQVDQAAATGKDSISEVM